MVSSKWPSFPTGSLRQKDRQMQAPWNHVGHARDEAPTQIFFGRGFVLIWENIKPGWHLTEVTMQQPFVSKFKTNRNKVQDSNISFNFPRLVNRRSRLVISPLGQTYLWLKLIQMKQVHTMKGFLYGRGQCECNTPVSSQTLRKGQDVKGYEKPETLKAGIIRGASGKGQVYWDLRKL